MAATNAQARRRLDARFDRLRPLADVPRPHRGWIRAIREALGMSTTALAARMGASQSRIPAIEHAEQAGSIRLETLERAAEALGCRLVYALVPRTSLDEMVRAQGRRKATAHIAGVAHNMRLEDQVVDGTATTEQIDELANDMIDRRGLWTDRPAHW
jgi:predicted DNA-binding mobile mystery protein A